MTNEDIARKLRGQASEMARDGDNLYRVRAFRQAAITVMALPDDVSTLVAVGGRKVLERVPGIGKSLAGTIADFVSLQPCRETGGVAAIHHR